MMALNRPGTGASLFCHDIREPFGSPITARSRDTPGEVVIESQAGIRAVPGLADAVKDFTDGILLLDLLRCVTEQQKLRSIIMRLAAQADKRIDGGGDFLFRLQSQPKRLLNTAAPALRLLKRRRCSTRTALLQEIHQLKGMAAFLFVLQSQPV